MSAPLTFDPAKVESLRPLLALGRQIRTEGIPYVVEGVIPAYHGAGFLVSQTKVGKTTFGLRTVKHISKKTPSRFLGRKVRHRKVLMLSLEDPKEYLAWLIDRAGFDGSEDADFYPSSLVLTPECLETLGAYMQAGGYTFVYIATFLHSIRGLVEGENDNAGMVRVVAEIKHFCRRFEVAALIEAHAGKGEDMSEGADPAKALRGASAAAGEADYILSLRRRGAAQSTLRVLSGVGRFVNFGSIVFNTDLTTGEMTVLSDGDADNTADADFALLCKVRGGLSTTPQAPTALARAAGWVAQDGRPNAECAARVHRALENRPGVEKTDNGANGKARRTTYRLREGVAESTLATVAVESRANDAQETDTQGVIPTSGSRQAHSGDSGDSSTPPENGEGGPALAVPSRPLGVATGVSSESPKECIGDFGDSATPDFDATAGVPVEADPNPYLKMAEGDGAEVVS